MVPRLPQTSWMASPIPLTASPQTISQWRVWYGDAFFLVWAADERAAREHVEGFGYPVGRVEPAADREGHQRHAAR